MRVYERRRSRCARRGAPAHRARAGRRPRPLRFQATESLAPVDSAYGVVDGRELATPAAEPGRSTSGVRACAGAQNLERRDGDERTARCLGPALDGELSVS